MWYVYVVCGMRYVYVFECLGVFMFECLGVFMLVWCVWCVCLCVVCLCICVCVGLSSPPLTTLIMSYGVCETSQLTVF